MELVEEGGYKFTIGYTTYNRKGLTIRRLNSLLAMDIPGNVEIIIVDNASSDGTFKAISDLTNGTKIKVYRNNENLGFSGNFVEVFRRAKGDYVMWSSDKDEVNLSGVQSLLDWIGSEKNPDIVVTGSCKELGMVGGCLSEDLNTKPSTSYGIAKDTLREFIVELNKSFSFTYKWIRIFNVYGEGQSKTSLMYLLDKAIKDKDKEFNMSGGRQLRDFLYIDDVARYIYA